MKRVLDKIFSRTVIAGVFFLIHVGVFVLTVQRFNEWLPWFSGFSAIVSGLVTVQIVSKRGNPETKIAWLIPVLLLPIFGTLFYLTFGFNRFSKRERLRMRDARRAFSTSMAALESAQTRLEREYPNAAARARYLAFAAGVPPCGDTEVEFLPVGEAMFAAMKPALENAEKFIFLEYFIVREGAMWSAIREILVRKARAGLDVRVMVDSFGSAFTLPKDELKKLRAEGIRCVEYNPFTPRLLARFNNRDHRKICVVDGRVGFTGGVNIGDQYINLTHPYGHWLDNAVCLRGGAVFALTAMFLSVFDDTAGLTEDFLAFRAPDHPGIHASGYVQPYSDSPLDGEPAGKNVYRSLIERADDYLYATTPYLVIDEALMSSLVTAARSGVDVRIMTPALSDGTVVHALTRSYYPALIEGGVRVYEYTPGIVHGKIMLSDDCYAVVGTINLDYRSLYLHHECGVSLTGCEAIKHIREDFLHNLEKSREITAADCKHVSLPRRLIRAALRLLAPLM